MRTNLIGKTVISVRSLNRSEMAGSDWPGLRAPLALGLEDGTVLYPGSDDKGSRPGEFVMVELSQGGSGGPVRSIPFSPDRVLEAVIKAIHPMPPDLLKRLGWFNGLVVTLDTTALLVSCDQKLSGPGTLMGIVGSEGRAFLVSARGKTASANLGEV